jgi:hypothetical protein
MLERSWLCEGLEVLSENWRGTRARERHDSSTVPKGAAPPAHLHRAVNVVSQHWIWAKLTEDCIAKVTEEADGPLSSLDSGIVAVRE